MEKHCRILGVRPGASTNEIRKAYHELIKVWHPDRFPNDPSLQQKALEKTKEITEAYRALSGPEGSAPSADRVAPNRAAWHPARAAAAAARVLRPRRDASGVRAFVVFTLTGGVLLGAAYALLVFSENSRKVMVNGVSFNEWEWGLNFRVGSTKDEVMAVQGAPDRIEGDTWFYGNDSVRFASDARVVNFSNAGGALRIRETTPPPQAPVPAFFTLGSTKEEVLATQGKPTREAGDEWRWGEDAVFFSKGRAAHYDNSSGRLRVKVFPSTSVNVAKDSAFGLGATKDDVLAIQGTPSRMAGDRWHYGLDTVLFSRGRLFGFSNAARGLRIRFVPLKPVSAPPGARFTVGSTADDVIAVQGTPTRVDGDLWYWDKDSATFAAGRVVSFTNRTGFLKGMILVSKPPSKPAPAKPTPASPAPSTGARKPSGWEDTRFEDKETKL